MTYVEMVNWLITKGYDFENVEKELDRVPTTDELTENAIDFAKGYAKTSKQSSGLNSIDTGGFRRILASKLKFQERLRQRENEAKSLKTIDDVRQYGLSPSRFTYKTLMSRFGIEESLARDIEQRLRSQE